MNKFDIEKMKNIMLAYLVKDLPDVGFVIIKFETEEKDLPEDSAYTQYLGKEMGIHFFEISYDIALEERLEDFERMMAHELIHVMQCLRGDTLDFSLPYREQLHEIEAYEKEDEVANYYKEKIVNNS